MTSLERKITNSFYRVHKRRPMTWFSNSPWNMVRSFKQAFSQISFLLMLPKYQNQINLNNKLGFWFVSLFGPVHTQPTLLLPNFHLLSSKNQLFLSFSTHNGDELPRALNPKQSFFYRLKNANPVS